jgi:formate/nitrite transporter FocA (FNT family)
MLPLLIRRDWPTFRSVIRFWVVVLISNLVGALIFAALISPSGLFPDAVYQALIDTGHEAVRGTFWPTTVRSVFAGWLIALMVWILPSARSERLLVILILTYIVAIGRLSHTVAGTIDAAFLVFSGNGTIEEFLMNFVIPTVIGNVVGGIGLVALLNHAPLAATLQGEPNGDANAS